MHRHRGFACVPCSSVSACRNELHNGNGSECEGPAEHIGSGCSKNVHLDLAVEHGVQLDQRRPCEAAAHDLLLVQPQQQRRHPHAQLHLLVRMTAAMLWVLGHMGMHNIAHAPRIMVQ